MRAIEILGTSNDNGAGCTPTAGGADGRQRFCAAATAFYRLVAECVARERGLRLGTQSEPEWQTPQGQTRDEVLRLVEPMLASVIADPTGILGTSYQTLLECELEIDAETGGFRLGRSTAHARKSSGSYYTPHLLVEHVLETSLVPVLEHRLGDASPETLEESLLGLRVCDPACGAGNFLIPAARLLAERLAQIRVIEHGIDHRTRSDVIRRCMHGVDLDPVAVLICRVALWIEANDPELTLGDLARNIRVGNALLGATPELVERGLPDEAFTLHEGDDRKVVVQLRKRNRKEREASAGVGDLDRLLFDAWCAAFVWDKQNASDAITTETLGSMPSLPESVHAEIERLRNLYGFFHWTLEFPGVFAGSDATGFDVVVGNPPFLNQLGSATATDTRTSALQQVLSGGVATGYSDTAARFVARSLMLCKRGGRVAFVQPSSLLSTADAMPIRQAVSRTSALRAVWISTEHAFDGASVYTCAVTFEPGGQRAGKVTRTRSMAIEAMATMEVDHDELAQAETWSPIVAAAFGIPEFAYESRGELSTLASATADFRDQYYGLDGFLVENADIQAERLSGADYPPIVTTGLIDLAECRWNAAQTKLLKRTWDAPRIDRAAMNERGSLGPWITERLVPKVLLATQTKIIEVYVDASGRYVPSTPMITVVPVHADAIWRVAAALASPVASALAMQRYAGAAMTAQAIKLSAKQSLRLPTPSDDVIWDEAARLLREAHDADGNEKRALLESYAKASIAAHGVPESDGRTLLNWWRSRLA